MVTRLTFVCVTNPRFCSQISQCLELASPPAEAAKGREEGLLTEPPRSAAMLRNPENL